MEIEINEWKEVDDKFYQETHSFPLMMEKVRKQCYVTFVGVPGSGKTTTSRHIALKLQRAGYEIVPLIDVKKLEEYSNSNFPQVFVLDDVVGKFGLDKTNYRPLERPDLQKFITEPRMRETKILMTSRHTIFKKLFSRNSFLTKDENVINLCDREHRLNGNDKQAILEAYGIDIQCLSVRLPKPFSAMFPLLCFLLSKKKKDQEDSSYNASDFLVSPFDGILEELQKMSKIHYASLVLCMMSWNHCLSESTLSSETFRKIKSDVLRSCKVDSFTDAWRFMDSLSEMEGTYTRRRSDDYTFIHDSMFEIVAYHYGRKHPEQILKYMSLNYIENYVKLEDSSSEISYTRQKFLPGMNKLIADEFSDLCLIMLEKEHYPFLAERIFFELKEKSIQFSDCITSTLKHPTIKHFFLRLLQRLSLDELETIFLSRQYVRIKSWRLRGVHYSLLKNEESEDFLTDISEICTTNGWLLYDGHIDMLQCILEKYKKESIDATKLLNKMTNIQKLHGDETINDDKKINEDKEQARLLMLGCCSENIQLVKLLISHLGPTAINTGCVYGRPMTPLSFACESSNIRVVEELIKNGADVNQRLNQQYKYKGTGRHLCLVVNELLFRKAYFEKNRAHTPLTAACTADNTDIIDMLLERGASINLHDVFLGEDSQTPLSTACMYGNLNVMVKLLEKGANIDLSDGTGNTLLTTAIMSGNIQLVDKLLRLGASINQQDGNGFTPLSCGCGSRDEKMERSMIPFEFYRIYNDIQRNNLSNQKGQMELIELLVQSGANVNDLDGLGDTPLTAACKSRKADVVRRLLRFSVDVNKEDASGNAPIHIACKDECWNIVDVLLQEGASINQRDTHGNTSLIRACTSMRTGLGTVRKLVELNADVNLPDREGRTPLVILCQKENLNGIVDLLCVDLKDHPPLTFVFKNGLLDWTTAFKQRDDNWKTAISFIELAQEKPQYGSIINIQDKLGKTALTMACRIGDLNLVAAIIAAGADLNLSNGCGLTPLNIAHMHSHLPIVELLVEQGADCKMDGYLFYKEILLAVLNEKSNEKNRIVRINNRFEPYRGNWLLFHSLVYLLCNFVRIEGIDDKTFQGELWKAVSRSDCCLLKYLISIGFDIEKDIRRYDQAQQDTVTEPLFHALINENDPEYGVKYRIDKIGFLLESGIDLNRRKVYEVDFFSVGSIWKTRCSAVIKKKIDRITGDMSVLTRTNHLKELYSKSVHPSDKELAKEYNTCLLEIKKYARRHSI